MKQPCIYIKKEAATLVVVGLLFWLPVTAQIDVSGTWQGLLRQYIMGSFTDSPYQLTIEQKGDSIYGIAYIEASEFLSIYAKMTFTGKVKGDKISIEEKEFIEGTDLNDAVGWCIKKLKLTHLKSKKGYRLKGNWTGYGSSNGKDCKPGLLYLDKESAKFTGFVKDSLKNTFLGAKVLIYNRTMKVKTGAFDTYPGEGVFKFYADTAHYYQLLITAKGYHDKFYNLKSNKEGETDTLLLKPILVGDIMEFGNVQFKQSTAYLLDNAKPVLNQLVRFLTDNPTISLEISGHTSNEGNPTKNKALSLDRANTIAYYLIENGIDKERLKTLGVGAEKPIANNFSTNGRKKNRRVEFRVLKK